MGLSLKDTEEGYQVYHKFSDSQVVRADKEARDNREGLGKGRMFVCAGVR